MAFVSVVDRLFTRHRNHALRAGQHAIITGGSSGLGFALAGAFARRGLDVTLIARDREKLNEARDLIAGAAPTVKVREHSVDVTDLDAVRAAIDEIAAADHIDVVVNSAGIMREGYFETLPGADFRSVMDIDFFGVLNVTRVCLPHLKATGGRVINVSSMAGLLGVFGSTAYCAAKHAVNGFSEALRLEVEPQGVTVQLVCPAEFDSPLVDELNTYRTPENRTLTQAFPVLGIDEVTREIVNGIDRGDALIIPGRVIRLAWLAQRLAPGLMKQFLRRQVASVYQGPGRAPVIDGAPLEAR
jgi:3-dehydrosphinganine reductase